MSLPLIDLAAAPADVLARHIDAALREQGFFVIAGHGVPASVVDAAFDASHRFFALPQAAKERWHIDGWEQRAPSPPQAATAPREGQEAVGGAYALLKRGFDPIGWQALDPGQPPDVKESFYLGVEAIGPNQWPDEALVPGFRAAMEAYSGAMEALARRLMALFELALGGPRGHFDGFMRHPTCTTRLLHYPPQPATARPGQIGCGAHTDWGALTLLAQDDAGGLQVQRADGSWIDVDPVPGAFVVNVGDMTQRWTNDRWRSTMHRVINRPSGRRAAPGLLDPLGGRPSQGDGPGAAGTWRDRWSIAYFFDLDAESVIVPLPSCTSAADPPRYAPVTAGEHLVEMYRRTTVGAAA